VTPDAVLFWILTLVTLGGGLAVILMTNPIYSSLALVFTMVGIAGFFVTLGAYFVAGVQLIVYAGAVMVLFVMVLMLFDLRTEITAFTRGLFTGALKIFSVGVFGGLVVGAISMGTSLLNDNAAVAQKPVVEAALGPDAPTKMLGEALFSRHIFGFEALGVLLLVIAVGTVALSRSRGGTHAK